MIFGYLRVLLIALVGLTIVYLAVSVYSRSVRREKLEKRWDAGQGDGPRDEYIRKGMDAYEKGLKKRLLWLIYILPLAGMAATVYWVNWD